MTRMDTAPDHVRELLETIDLAVPRLLALDDAASSRRPAAGKWSPREVIGHLVDSASNNHQRFVRARWRDDLVFDGYAQDDWVKAQRYQEAPWAELVGLWAAFNRHIARVMAATPSDVLARPHRRHNLHQLAFRPVPENQPATLEYFMRDYVAHLKHHLESLIPDHRSRIPDPR